MATVSDLNHIKLFQCVMVSVSWHVLLVISYWVWYVSQRRHFELKHKERDSNSNNTIDNSNAASHDLYQSRTDPPVPESSASDAPLSPQVPDAGDTIHSSHDSISSSYSRESHFRFRHDPWVSPFPPHGPSTSRAGGIELMPVRLVNLGVGALMVVGGIFHALTIYIPDVVVGVYVALFGLTIVLLEFQIPPQVSRYASFLFSFLGRGIFYIFAGSILLEKYVLDIVFGSIIGIIGIGYVVLEFIPSIEPPQNMREADAGWGAEQV